MAKTKTRSHFVKLFPNRSIHFFSMMLANGELKVIS